MIETRKNPLVVIVGPSAVGKTAVSMALAQNLNGEIVSADSRLLYRGMDIGTAKPSQAEQRAVPHHLIDVADPDETWSLAVYQRKAYAAIDNIHAGGHLPFLVGGTGQYIRAIIEGWLIPPQKPDLGMRETLTAWADEIGAEALHDRLQRLDADAAEIIDYRNVRRVVRALEVIFKTGERFSDLRKRQVCRYAPIVLGISRDRETLYERVDQRIDQMLSDGLVDEVRSLLAAGYPPGLPTLSAIGYAEIIQHLQGEVTLDEAVALIKRHTRIFIRHQTNWFKPDDPRITWFEAEGELADRMEIYIRRQLSERS